MADPPPTHRDVEAVILAFDADPSPEHERALRDTLRAAGKGPEEIERIVAEGRSAVPRRQ